MDLTLSDEQLLLKESARAFAAREVRPAAERIARSAELRRHPWSECREVFRRGVELGFTRMLIPEEWGGMGRRTIDAAIVFEELGAADVSIAADYFSLNATVPLVIAQGGTPGQKARWLGELASGEPLLLAGALSEPNVAGSELFCQTNDPQRGIRTSARREGDMFVINGRKSAFVTNGGIADRYLLMCRTDPDKPFMEGISVFYVPGDAAGLTCGPRTELLGWHASHHAELMLDDLRVPAGDLIGQAGQGLMLLGSLPQMPICLAACFVGLARAAYECALGYSRERHSGGVPIGNHQAVALKLADMYAQLAAARLLVWDAALAVDGDPGVAAMLKAPLAKTAAVDAAIFNAQRCVEILGGYGVTMEYPAARYLQDAWVGYSCDFTRDMLRLGMAASL